MGLSEAETTFNYFVGDKSDWRSNVRSYEVVAYQGLYDGIDLHTWGRRDGLKYEFHVAPGSDYQQIRISYEGIDELWIDESAALHIRMALGELVDDAPYIYQDIAGRQVEVAGGFELIDADTYAFNITGAYDPHADLIIDPDLAWATYLGISKLDRAKAIALDIAGNAYVTGTTVSTGWATPGAYDTSHNGGWDVFVAKLDLRVGGDADEDGDVDGDDLGIVAYNFTGPVQPGIGEKVWAQGDFDGDQDVDGDDLGILAYNYTGAQGLAMTASAGEGGESPATRSSSTSALRAPQRRPLQSGGIPILAEVDDLTLRDGDISVDALAHVEAMAIGPTTSKGLAEEADSPRSATVITRADAANRVMDADVAIDLLLRPGLWTLPAAM